MKVLIIRFSSIGDIVLTAPVIRCIKKQLEGSVVHYLTKDKFASIVTANPYIDRIYTLNDNWMALTEKLKKENYDCIIDLHNNIRSRRVKRALKVKSYTLNKLNIRKWLWVNFKINTMPDKHIVDRYMDTVKQIGVKNDYKGLEFFIPAKEEIQHGDLPLAHTFGYVAIAIGGTYATKRLPIEKLIALCNDIKPPLVILGGAEDVLLGGQISDAVGLRCYNACGLFSLAKSASVIKGALKVVTHDTGMMHIAAAFNKEIISIWGNTSPSFGMAPYMPLNPDKSHVFEVSGLKCRPCSKLGYNQCPKKHFNCMQLQNIETIVDKVNGI